AADVHRERGRTVADKVLIEELHQLQIKAALRPQVENMVAGELSAPLDRDVSLVSHQVKFIHLQRRVLDGEVDGAIVLQLHSVDVGGKLVHVPGNDQAAGLPHRSANINGPGDGRVTGDLALKVSADQRVKIQTGKLQGNLARPVAAQTHFAVKAQLRIGEV